MKPAAKVHVVLAGVALALFGANGYRQPPKAILDVLNAPVTPTLTLNPTHAYAMQGAPVRYPPIAELAQPMRRLAGIRINPLTNGLHNAFFNSSLTLRKVPEGTEIKIALPPDPKLSTPRWSPDGKHFVFTNSTDKGIEIWVGEAATGKTHRLEGVRVNDVFGTTGAPGGGGRGAAQAAAGGTVQWLADSKTLLVHAIKPNRGPEPQEPAVPAGPNIQESLGDGRGVATHEDMLQVSARRGRLRVPGHLAVDAGGFGDREGDAARQAGHRPLGAALAGRQLLPRHQHSQAIFVSLSGHSVSVGNRSLGPRRQNRAPRGQPAIGRRRTQRSRSRSRDRRRRSAGDAPA